MTTATKTHKAFDRMNEWLDRYNAARNCRPVLTLAELRAACSEGCDPIATAAENDALATEYDA